MYGPGAAFRGGKRLLRRTTFPVMKLCLEGLCSRNCLIVKLSLVLLKTAELGGVLPRCGSLHLDFGDLYLDQVADGNETDQPVSLHDGHVAKSACRHF